MRGRHAAFDAVSQSGRHVVELRVATSFASDAGFGTARLGVT